MKNGRGAPGGVHSARGHALWATATRLSSLPRSLAKPAESSRPVQTEPSRPPLAGRPGPARPARSPLCPWPRGGGCADLAAPAARDRPSRRAGGPDPSPRGPRLALPAIPGNPAPARAAPPGTGERGRGKAGPAAWSGGRAAPRLRTMPKPRAAGEKPGPPLQPTHRLGLGASGPRGCAGPDGPGRLPGPREARCRCASRAQRGEAGQGPRDRAGTSWPRGGSGRAGGRSWGLRKRARRLLQEEWGRRGVGLCSATSAGKVSNLGR